MKSVIDNSLTKTEFNGILYESRCAHKCVPFDVYWPRDGYGAGEPLSWVVGSHWQVVHVPIENSTPMSWLNSVGHINKRYGSERETWLAGILVASGRELRGRELKWPVSLYTCMTLLKKKLISKKKRSFIKSKTNFSLHVFSFKEIEWLGQLAVVTINY